MFINKAMNNVRYFLRAGSYIMNRFVLARKYLIGRSKKYGMEMKFKTQDGGGRKIYKRGIYEEELSDFLIENLKFEDDDIILDVGANIGWYSVLFDKMTPANVFIYAFEPDPDNFHCLTHNIQRNNRKNIIPVQKGISDKTEKKTLYLYKSSNTGRHSMLNINTQSTIEVETVKFDDFIDKEGLNINKIKFLKIDIEGYEYKAFQGGTKLLSSVPYILTEFSPEYMRKGGLEPAKMLDLLKEYQFVPYIIENQKKVAIDDNTILNSNSNLNLIMEKSP
ncbi:MAG: FkbM family methyltransferase [Bacteroidota bacterium]